MSFLLLFISFLSLSWVFVLSVVIMLSVSVNDCLYATFDDLTTFLFMSLFNLFPRAFPSLGGGAPLFPAPPPSEGKALGTRLFFIGKIYGGCVYLSLLFVFSILCKVHYIVFFQVCYNIFYHIVICLDENFVFV